MKKTEAKWMDDQYVVTDTESENEWYSTDGENWVDQNGRPVSDQTFVGASIVLLGGPCDGVVVG